ncbi:hypothetical protein P152DRAFT_511954 [Eremomyces bilateralis CBS 781.70]|uniref:Ubiquitin-like domain-containing protein n=1 Tax=Eremomyces bilateralis CBS 781.70 TaxID=1392243 RepID=A0A6G1GCS6_9PEZI|nr:uncharacterized protein P152DRAFT_511954 [Eremomyces bilateralis CBS 781.70]KAF1815887.1 hypothetical protein P152DRAFT_511954 [Eremomyces bilateralis CBS 781.70]
MIPSMESDVLESPTSNTMLKKSRFAKPAWAAARSTSKDTGTEDGLFSRSTRAYEEILAEEEEIKRAKEERKQRRRHRDSPSRDSPKRRRLSREDDDSSAPVEAQRSPADKSLDRETERSHSTRTADYGTIHIDSITSADKRFSAPGTTGEESRRDAAIERKIRSTVNTDDEDDESDEDLQLLIEAARQQRLSKEQANSLPAVPPPTVTSKASSDDKVGGASTTALDGRPNYIVEILITSKLPGTQPVVITRKLSQRLKEVHAAYCDAMGFTPEMFRRVFLTWRNQKIWGFQTCEALGLDLPPIDADSMDETGVGTVQISMEMVTPEIFEANKQAAELSFLQEPTERSRETRSSEPVEAEQADSSKIRVILRAKDYGELKIAVKPDTTILSMIHAYRKRCNVQSEKAVKLMFDGEELGEDQSVADSDIGDMELIEVHVK